MLVCEYGRRWQVVFELVTSHVSDVRLKIHYSWCVDEVVMYPVHHRCSCINSWLFQAGPPKRLQHGRDAEVPAELSADETRSSSLDHLKLVDAVLGMKVPDCRSIFHVCSNYGLVVGLLNDYRLDGNRFCNRLPVSKYKNR